MSAIVQQYHISSTNALCDRALDVFGGWGGPIVPRDVPHHRPQPQLPNRSQRDRTAPAKGRTKQIRMLADRIGDRALAPQDFIPHLFAGSKNQWRVSERM